MTERNRKCMLTCRRCGKTGHTEHGHFPEGHPMEVYKCARCGLRGHEVNDCDLPDNATAFLVRKIDPTSET